MTWNELLKALLPKIEQYPWAMDTIVDLWRLCAPTPDTILTPYPNPNEKRIIHPGQFAKWWGDVRQKMGYEMTAAEAIPLVRTH